MANEDQAQADLPTESTVADPLDVANSTNSGTKSAMDDYQAEVEAALRAEIPDQQGEEPVEDEVDDTQEDATQSEEPETQTDELEEEEEDGEPEIKTSKRVRLNDPLDQKVAAVAKAMGVNLIEAAKIVEGQNPTKHQVQFQDNQSADDVETVASVQARLEELEDMEATASSSLEFETANQHRKEANKLRNKLMDLKIAEVQSKAIAEQADAEKFYADYAKSEEKAIGFYPDAVVKDSSMHKEIAKLDAEMRELGDPLYYSTDKPFILAKEAAKNLGIPMKKPGSAPVKKSVQHRPIQPAGGNARTTATEPTKRAAEAIGGIQSMRDYQDMVAAL